MISKIKNCLIVVVLLIFSYIGGYTHHSVSPYIQLNKVNIFNRLDSLENSMNILTMEVMTLNKKIKVIDKVRLTAYTYPIEGGDINGDDNYTSIGAELKYGHIAADPKILPYGTKVYIPHFKKWFTVMDTGSAMRHAGRKGIVAIDIFLPDKDKALDFGVKKNTKILVKI